MVFVCNQMEEWTGDICAADGWSEMINEALETGLAKRGELFRVGPNICYAPTDIEEQAVRKYWKAYSENLALYAGTFAAECAFEWITENRGKFVRIGKSVYLCNIIK